MNDLLPSVYDTIDTHDRINITMNNGFIDKEGVNSKMMRVNILRLINHRTSLIFNGNINIKLYLRTV